ncbi:hypothetical protein CSIM01_03672 [Colletotrichum simmondsii]|uniref:Tat pathway signal sequence n=1 Tax=Colletotrichum simmondsii TaxID=703756 RepID=A0A135RRE2_9PEZI|nr:hypothetical protein CSIM01_03672 [Colletotrichum simmondsii]
MEKLRSVFWQPTPKYNAVRTSQSDDDDQQEGVEEKLRSELAALESNIWCLRASLLITIVALLLVTIFAVVDRVSYDKASLNCGKGHIGSDPNGFVPPASNVLVNGNFADWKKPDGTVAKLPAYYSTVSYRQTYIIRSFHQMHCLISIAEEYGHRANNVSSQWAPKHIAHCLNAIREAIMCLADATPMTYVNGFAVGHVTDDQQFMCRDWSALRKWANDPVRGIRYKNIAPEGAGYDNNTEILPFPELSELEKVGLA